MFYPIGSFYWSTNNISPATLFGGTWVQVKEAFVYASTAFNATIQGEKTHTLTVNEMPSHTHTQATVGLTSAGYDGTKYAGYYNRDYSGHGTVISTTLATGGGSAHNNMPPYITAYCWYRTA